MKYLKLVLAVVWGVCTIGVLYLVFLMFTVFAGFAGISQIGTGVFSTLLVIYLLVSICYGGKLLDEWLIGAFR